MLEVTAKQLNNEYDIRSLLPWDDKDVQKILSTPDIADFSDVDALVFRGCKFSANVWDFSEYNTLSLPKKLFIYDFEKIQSQYRNYAKVFILYQIYVQWKRPSSTKTNFDYVAAFCRFLKEKRVNHPKFISLDIVKEFFDRQTCKEVVISGKKTVIKRFLMEIEARNQEISYRAIYDEILNVVDKELINAEMEAGKIPQIPEKTFKKIISLALKDIYNEELDIVSKQAACMTIILAETGMRIGEFARIEINLLKELRLSDEDDVFHYLRFKTYKTTGTKEWLWTKTYMTDKAILAYKTLESLLHSYRKKSKYLTVSRLGSLYSYNNVLGTHMQRFFINHQDELGFNDMNNDELEHFSCITISEDTYNAISVARKYDIGKQIYYTTPHQYRVTLCNILASKKHLDWVRKHMNHMTSDMTQHYIRKAEMRKKQRNQVEIDVLQRRANKDGDKLETNIETDNEIVRKELSIDELREAYNDINAFLEKKKFNVFKDIKGILAYIKNRATLTETDEGFCARTAFDKLCKRQEYISSANDLYYIGPQIIAIEELGFTYKRFKEKTEVIKHNQKMFKENPKYKTELEREKRSMEKYIEKKVFPEILALGKAIEEKGKEAIIEKHPNIKSIVSNYTKIKDEVLKWKKTS